MTTQTESLAGIENYVRTEMPKDVSSVIFTTIDNHGANFDKTKVVKPSTSFPSGVTLPNAVGKEISLSSLIASADKGVLITFYRGEWCPYCNIALSFLQKNFDDFTARGITLVAISPELPSTSLTIVEKNELKYEVLSDRGNELARKLGLVWKQPEALTSTLTKVGGVDWVARNGDGSGEIPVATNILVDKNGVIRNVYADTNWAKRLEPSTMLEWADAL